MSLHGEGGREVFGFEEWTERLLQQMGDTATKMFEGEKGE